MTEREIETLGKLNVAKNYAEMALRWNNDGSRRHDNGADPANDSPQQVNMRLSLRWIEAARDLLIRGSSS